MKRWKRFTALFRRKDLDAEMAEEMRLHLERRVEENVANGMSSEDARYAARREFGGLEQVKELAREQRPWVWLEHGVRDLRYAASALRRNPGFAATAILTLALGIGACTAMFSVVNAVLFKPLPFREPDRLVWIENVLEGGLSGRTTRADVLNGWREQTKSLESLAGYFAFSDYGRLMLAGGDTPERLRDVAVTDNFLPTLGIPLLHGRNFTADECGWPGYPGEGGPGAVILSHSFWQRRFAGNPAVVGTTVTLNNAPATIAGVLPASFDFDSIFSPGNEVDVITPFPLTTESAKWGNTLFGIGRLRAGVTVDQAQAELTVISERLHETIRGSGAFGARVSAINSALRGKFRSAFLLLAGAVACVLAVACVNLSNLLLARVNVRRQEFQVRIALGASRGHLLQQALTESLLLAFAGSVVGVPLAMWCTGLLAELQTFGVPLLQGASVDPTALAVSLGVTALAGVICGILPAWYLSFGPRAASLQSATSQRTAGRSSSSARNALVVAEVALASLLLVGAGLLFRSFDALLEVNLGFQPQHAVVWRIGRPQGITSAAQVDQRLGELVRRVAALPGVEEAGLSDTLPLGRNRSWDARAADVQYPEGKAPTAYPRLIDPRYLRAMQIPLIAGRSFEENFDPKAAKAVVINQSLARRLWPDQDPLGRKIQVNGQSTVIGVVADVRHRSLEQAGENEMYLDYRQSGDWSTMEMVVRSSRPPASLIPEVRATMAAFDASLPNGEFYELGRLVSDAVAPRRFITRLLGFFSVLALSLAGLGLYGVIAYSVAQRTQEIGIRMAVGAQRFDVLKLVLQSGMKLVALGIALGLAGSLVAMRLLQSQLFGVSAHDPVTFAGIALLLTAVAGAACLLPAVRATRVSPMVALRAE